MTADATIRLDKPPYDGETTGEQLMRLLETAEPWQCEKRGSGRAGGADRIDAAIKENIAWKREQIRIGDQLRACGLTWCDIANANYQIKKKFKNRENDKCH